MLTKHEWRWVTICSLILLALFALPTVWGWLFPPEGWQLYRGWLFSNDYTQYRSAMAQGYDGSWLIIDRFTPEPHRPILQYSLYVALGHVARWLHLPLEIPYIITSGIAIVVLTCAIYACAATFLPDIRDRKLAFMLALSVGPTWLVSVLQTLVPTIEIVDRYKSAISRAEFNTFLVFGDPPHLPLALATLLFILITVYRQWQSKARFPLWRLALTYLLPTLILGLLNPFSLPTLLLPLGVFWLARSIQARRPLWQEALPLILMGLTALPLVAYNFLTFTQDPFWGKAYGSQNFQPSYPIDVVLLSYGVLGILAVAGTVRTWRTQVSTCVLFFWSLIVILMGYIPVPYQRRFSLGLAPVLALLAVAGWRWVAEQNFIHFMRRHMITRVIGSAVLILGLWGQNLMFYSAYVLSHLGKGTAPYAVFQPRALVDAAAYLDVQGESVVVLTCEEMGNLLAGQIRGRVVLGHAGATIDVAARRETVTQFFANTLSTEAQIAFLEKHNVSHILTTAIAPLQCGPDYVPPDGWTPVFDQEDIVIYEKLP
jgi:hypothetical protein